MKRIDSSVLLTVILVTSVASAAPTESTSSVKATGGAEALGPVDNVRAISELAEVGRAGENDPAVSSMETDPAALAAADLHGNLLEDGRKTTPKESIVQLYASFDRREFVRAMGSDQLGLTITGRPRVYVVDPFAPRSSEEMRFDWPKTRESSLDDAHRPMGRVLSTLLQAGMASLVVVSMLGCIRRSRAASFSQDGWY